MGCRDLHPTGRDSPSGRVCPLGFASFSLRFDRSFGEQCQSVSLGAQPQLTVTALLGLSGLCSRPLLVCQGPVGLALGLRVAGEATCLALSGALLTATRG